MQTLEQQHEQSDDRSAQKAKTSYPEEIIEEIFSRLPIKSILRFRSLSKPWLSTITIHQTPDHSCHPHRFIISARDHSNGDRHLFSCSLDGGSVTHLIKIDTPYCLEDTEAEHSNELVCFTYGDLFYDNFNPSTHKFFKLPHRVSDNYIVSNLFGFDESRNEHKVLNISQSFEESDTIEIMIFSLSNYSWRKIDVDLPVNVSRHRWYYTGGSICVNSTIHLMLHDPLEILAFDLRTEKFSIVKIPSDAVPQDTLHPCTGFIKINDLLGIVCHDRVEESNEMHIWILQDYEKRVWVTETIRFPGSWIKMGRPFPWDSGNTDEIMFSPSEDLFEIPVYDMKSRCFKSIQLTLGHQFVWPEAVELEEIKCYVKSLIPLQNDTCLRF